MSNALYQELVSSLSEVDLSPVLRAILMVTPGHIMDAWEILDILRAAYPEISCLQSANVTGSMLEQYLDTFYNIDGDYVDYYAYRLSDKCIISKKEEANGFN